MKPRDVQRVRLPSQQAEWWLAATDLAIGTLGVVLVPVALTLVASPAPPPDATVLAFPLACALLMLWRLQQLGHYDRRRSAAAATFDVLAWTAGLGALNAAVAGLAGLDPAHAAAGWVVVAISLPWARSWVRHHLDARGLWSRPTVVVGTGATARKIASTLERTTSLGLPVIAFASLDPTPRIAGPIEIGDRQLPVLPVERLITPDGGVSAAHVVIAPEPHEMAACVALFERLSALGRGVDLVPPIGDLPLASHRLLRLAGGDAVGVRICERIAAPFAQSYKRAFDLVVGLAIGLLTAPLIAAIAALIWLTDGRPVLYRQQRVGMNRRPFGCLKFRTMVPDAERRLQALLESNPAARDEWLRDRKLKDDPRISRIGHLLRRTSLDELPQLWNVLRGEMSLIGPRPVVEEELARYGDRAALYLKTRPGLTGLWQVSGRSDVDYARRVALDSHYVRQ